MITVTYHKQSGFSVETDEHLLIFDYIGGALNVPVPNSNAIAFVSHAHSDHYSHTIERWFEEKRLQLIAGYDVPTCGIRMKPGDFMSMDGVHITAYGSTDAGVSFFIEVDGARIYHAGDYNFWHWRDESTQEEVLQAEHAFVDILDKIKKEAIDLAFFPVDPRMGGEYDEGALRFVEAVRPKHIIPMHFGDISEAAREFLSRAMPEGVYAHALTYPGQSLVIDQ